MSAFLELLLRGADARTITEFFFWLIMVSLLLAMFFRKNGRSPAYVNYTATLLTSLGILGTFIGIVVGLLGFNVTEIDGSIEALLQGLQTAFITSLVGMSASIIYKVTGAISVFVKLENVELQDVGAEDVYRAINEQGKLMLESSLIQQQLLKDLKRAIVGGEDDTLVSQVKLLRGDMNDNHKTTKSMDEHLAIVKASCTEQQQYFQVFSDKLWLKLQDVADTIAKSATEEVIKALKDVITDFNNNLTEQFGENFKALDESVKKLVVWQGNYSQQIEQMVEQYALGVAAINQTKDSVSIISEKSAHIPETMNNLQQVMEVNQHQVEELERHLEVFKDMRDRAVEAVPEIRKQVEATVTEITQSVTAANEHYTTLLSESDKYIKQHVESSNDLLNQFVTNTKEGIDAVKAGLVEGSEAIGKDLKTSSEEVKKAIVEGAENFVKASLGSNDSLTNTSNELEKQSGIITQQLDDTVKEIHKNVRIMVEELINESEKIGASLKESNQQVNSNLQQVQEQVANSIDKMQSRMESSLEEVMKAQVQEVKRSFVALEDEVKSTVGLTGEAVNKEFKMFDQLMENELEKVMQSMGNALATISGQFTSDYEKLTKAMSEIVNQKGR